jgi:hypothetical protein
LRPRSRISFSASRPDKLPWNHLRVESKFFSQLNNRPTEQSGEGKVELSDTFNNLSFSIVAALVFGLVAAVVVVAHSLVFRQLNETSTSKNNIIANNLHDNTPTFN